MLETLSPLLVGLAALFGLIIGSFLNVVVYRVPAGLSVVTPRSACPNCTTPIRERDNIPVVSWLLLRGRCRDCEAPISARYPLVEAATAALFGAVTYWLLHHDHETAVPVWLYLCAIGVALFLIDLDVMRLPDQIVLPSYPVVAVGLIGAGLASGDWPVARTLESTALWALVFALPWFATAGRGMGFGDVKLAPLLGACLGWLGWGESLVGLLGGFLIATIVSITLMVILKTGHKIAYGPYMLTGALVGLFAGDPLWRTYLDVMGL